MIEASELVRLAHEGTARDSHAALLERIDGLLLAQLAIHLARAVLAVDDEALERAIVAAEAWAACPCQAHARAAADTQTGAVAAALREWTRIRPVTPVAWGARVTAWAADVPRLGWQAVTVITGACHATSSARVTELVQLWLQARL